MQLPEPELRTPVPISSKFKGILLEIDGKDEGQQQFVQFVLKTLSKIHELGNAQLGRLGEEFLKEFGDTQLSLASYHDVEGVKYSLLIRPPLVKNLVGGITTKIEVAETKNLAPLKSLQALPKAHLASSKAPPTLNKTAPLPISKTPSMSPAVGKAQIIECWWPGSENSALRQGITLLPPLTAQKKIVLLGQVKIADLEMGHRPRKDKQKEASRVQDNSYTLRQKEFFYQGQRHTFRIALIHEMIHAWHGLKGTSLAVSDAGTKKEEMMVVGLNGYEGLKYTENKFRYLLGMEPRVDYKSLSITMDKNQATTFRAAWDSWCNKSS